jgi:hypothetical protein
MLGQVYPVRKINDWLRVGLVSIHYQRFRNFVSFCDALIAYWLTCLVAVPPN